MTDYLGNHRVARLATINQNCTQQLIPIVFANDKKKIYFVIDNKPKLKSKKKLKRLENIERNPYVTLLVDDYSEDWRKLSYTMIYATAKILDLRSKEKAKALELLRQKYPQYRSGGYLPPEETAIVVSVTPTRMVHWCAKSAHK